MQQGKKITFWKYENGGVKSLFLFYFPYYTTSPISVRDRCVAMLRDQQV
jgi:hypothetical protein